MKDGSLWTWFRKNLLHAPPHKIRHNKEMRLSNAISVGTLPTKLHATLLIYFLNNIIYYYLLNMDLEKGIQVFEDDALPNPCCAGFAKRHHSTYRGYEIELSPAKLLFGFLGTGVLKGLYVLTMSNKVQEAQKLRQWLAKRRRTKSVVPSSDGTAPFPELTISSTSRSSASRSSGCSSSSSCSGSCSCPSSPSTTTKLKGADKICNSDTSSAE